MSICQFCGREHGPRKNLGIKVDEKDRVEMENIRQRFNCIDQDFSIKNIPPGTPQEIVDKFLESVIGKKAELHSRENAWWQKMIDLYDLKGEVYVDFVTGDLYVFEDKK